MPALTAAQDVVEKLQAAWQAAAPHLKVGPQDASLLTLLQTPPWPQAAGMGRAHVRARIAVTTQGCST